MNATKFFCFNQNNSGGSFIINDNVAHYVIVEALDADQANMLAERVGIYFNGCNDGTDCSCCGDRWSELWRDSKGTDEPMVYDMTMETVTDIFTRTGKPICHVYYLDGTKKTVLKTAKKESLQ